MQYVITGMVHTVIEWHATAMGLFHYRLYSTDQKYMHRVNVAIITHLYNSSQRWCYKAFGIRMYMTSGSD